MLNKELEDLSNEELAYLWNIKRQKYLDKLAKTITHNDLVAEIVRREKVGGTENADTKDDDTSPA